MSTEEFSSRDPAKVTESNSELSDEQLDAVAGGGVVSLVHRVMDAIKNKVDPHFPEKPVEYAPIELDEIHEIHSIR
jgi:hypothetical protein